MHKQDVSWERIKNSNPCLGLIECLNFALFIRIKNDLEHCTEKIPMMSNQLKIISAVKYESLGETDISVSLQPMQTTLMHQFKSYIINATMIFCRELIKCLKRMHRI